MLEWIRTADGKLLNLRHVRVIYKDEDVCEEVVIKRIWATLNRYGEGEWAEEREWAATLCRWSHAASDHVADEVFNKRMNATFEKLAEALGALDIQDDGQRKP